MKRLLPPALAFAVFLVVPIFAESHGPVPFPKKDPLASVTPPAGWKALPYDIGVEVQSPDGQAFATVEATTSSDVQKLIKDAMTFFQGRGITIDPSTAERSEKSFNGFTAVCTRWTGTNNGSAARMGMKVISLHPGQGVLVFYWTPYDNTPENEAGMAAMIESITPVVKK